MPRSPASPCTNIRCPNLRPCSQHTKRAWQSNEGRSAASRGYDGDWSRLRAQVLIEEPYCRLCYAPSTTADHILPLATHPQLRLVRANIQALCTRCQRHKTASIDSKQRPTRPT